MNIKEKLIQYTDVQEEIKDLRRRIDKLEKNNVAIDSVKGSSANFPYTACNFIVEGINTARNAKIDRYKIKLKEFYDKLLIQQTEVEEYINAIQDSKIRQIFRYKYIENLEWYRIAQTMNYNTEDAPRKKHDRFLEKC